jgi:hypothetical protein
MKNDMQGTAIDARIGRREFVAGAGAVAGAIVAPFALRAAAAESLAAAVRAAVTRAAPLADWHIDDQWGPRYAEAIPYPRPAEQPAMAAAVASVDAAFVAV